MSMIRTVGITTIFSVIYLIGIMFGSTYNNEIKELKSLIKLVSFIKCQIDNYNLSVSEIFMRFQDDYFEQNGLIKEAIENGFQEAVKNEKYLPYSSSEVREIIKAFSIELGKGFSSDEVKLCQICEERLTESYQRLKELIPARKKLCRTIFGALGATVTILLL